MLEIQKAGEEEIKYNNPRNEMDNGEINDLKENLLNDNLFHDNENLQLPELKFSWWWLLFGIPFFIDLYRYVTRLKQLCTNYQNNIERYGQKVIELQQKTTTQQKLIDQYFDGQDIDLNMNNNIEELNFSKNKYENEWISQKNQIKELKVKLKELNRLNKQKDEKIKKLKTELQRCYKKLDAREEQNYKRHILHKEGKDNKFLETKSTKNINYHGMNGYINDIFDIKPERAGTASNENDFLI